jgi:hypothetical protein
VRQVFSGYAVKEGTGHSREEENDKDGIATTHEDEHGRGTDAGEGPAKAEDESADDVAGVGIIFGGKDDFFSLCGFEVSAFNDLHQDDAEDDGGADDAVHVERLEVEHFVYPEPGNGFGFIEGHAEEDADDDEFGQSHVLIF